jgi:hypothetical protein
LVSDQLFANDNVNDLSENKKAVIDRWRLILGKKAEDHQINFSSPGSSGLAGQSSSGSPAPEHNKDLAKKRSKRNPALLLKEQLK